MANATQRNEELDRTSRIYPHLLALFTCSNYLNMRAPNWASLLLVVLSCPVAGQSAKTKERLTGQRAVVIMFDGFGMSYYRAAPMPFVESIGSNGLFKEVRAVMPTVTNTNNASICCADFPEQNGITGNSFLGANGTEEYMEDKELLTAPTLFERLKVLGIPSALISAKKKSIGLLSAGATVALSPEMLDSTWSGRLGTPPGIYTPEVNYWTMSAALYLLQERPDIRCLYVHTTDYPMHMWPPGDPRSDTHLATMDSLIARVAQVAPDAMILITADHDMNHKNRCVDIQKALAREGVKIRTAISAERDKYVKHHRGYGGTSYVYLERPKDAPRVMSALHHIDGVENVMTRAEAAATFHLMPARIGDLVVLGDRSTVFGTLEDTSEVDLPDDYRTHGSLHEIAVPLFIYNGHGVPASGKFEYNKDLLGWLLE